MSPERPTTAINGYDEPNRPPRLPRWTRQEILVLIQGKKVAESRARRRGVRGPGGPGPPVEPKWASVSAYCRRHGVDRGPVQCRKRWSNLAGDFKKIREWEARAGGGEGGGGVGSFWAMRNDVRRENRLPGFFDREVYEMLDGTAEVGVGEAEGEGEEGEKKGVVVVERGVEGEEVEEAVFDSGRTAAEDGLFSDSEVAVGAEEEGPVAVAAAAPLSEKCQPFCAEEAEPGSTNGKNLSENPEKATTSREEQPQKRRRMSPDEAIDDSFLQNRLINVLEQNSQMMTAQLEAQNINCRLDREQRKEQADGLLGVLNKLADALSRIADKL
ncbi:hypothetical protein QJS10_CPA08g00413 [Acorus calamus]|uniref:Myb-like domain-containing protein n=1 Tax=Acorus calamus TaxID=4465 RepID=A0AAV9E8E3_ACOCL|nr:hypothetical protein QJS10_CPA08g00413 [Acorus calamus]